MDAAAMPRSEARSATPASASPDLDTSREAAAEAAEAAQLRALGYEKLLASNEEADREFAEQEAPAALAPSGASGASGAPGASDAGAASPSVAVPGDGSASGRSASEHKAELEKLERLLQKASQYTAFLESQLERVHDEALQSPEAPGEKRARMDVDKLPALAGGALKPYQEQGFRWLIGLWHNGLNGILADEMGLGKTVQTISLFARLREMGVFGWRLVVAPLSTLPNWVAEFQRWAPSVPVLMYHGTKEERQALRKRLLGVKSPQDFPVVVTTYEIVCRDRAGLQPLNWAYLVVDEGHRLKNRDCRLIKELNQLVGTQESINGGCSKLLLTGTPLQNNIAELWSLLNFLLPSVFSDLSFFTSVFEFDDPSGDMKKVEESIVSKLHRILRPFMLRRLKSQVEKFLPPKLELVVYCGMPPEQREVYDAVKRGELAQLMRAASAGQDKRSFLNVLMQLRKAANHPYLHFDPTLGAGGSAAPSGAVPAAAPASHTDESLVTCSGKLLVLDRLLRGLRTRGHKVLVFSQFTSMLDVIDDYLRFLRPDWKYARLDGSTHFTERQGLMKDFNDPASDVFCFLLSTRAGGVGINLMSADTVVIFDSDWNPHQDSQAQDRAHRIGQTKPVVVYRFITSRSVELKVLERANSKRKLERVVVTGATSSSSKSASAAAKLAKGGGGGGGEEADGLTGDELRALLLDDFTGHKYDVGDLPLEDVERVLLNRDALFSGATPRRGSGYEIVEHKASAIVGEVS